jgi:hypothetical protein
MDSGPFGPDAPRPFDEPFVPFQMTPKPWEPFSFNKVSNFPQT